MKIRFDEKKCTGCAACQMACLDQRDIFCEKGQPPLRYVTLREPPMACHSIGCVHCGKCMEVCPQNAITRNDLGFVALESDKCVGCGLCQKICPLHVISIHPETGKVVKCDGCSQRIREGLLPACVHTCPTEALWLES